MANPLAIALALYGGYKGYKAGKERGGGIKSIIGAALGAAGGYYGGQYLGGKLGMQNVAGTETFTANMMQPFQGSSAIQKVLPPTDEFGRTAAQIGETLPSAGTNLGTAQVGNMQPGILSSVGQFAKDRPGLALGTAAGLGAYASGMFEPEPYKRAQFTYNLNYPDLYRGRQFFVQDPKTGDVRQQEQLAYIPEENVSTTERFGPYAMEVKTMNTGGLVDAAHFAEGGMPVKTTHDENDANNYKRANGYVADHTDGANKDEDTILAQLADGEFVTRTDGILGAGILMGASPNDEKEMRKKGAEFFYDQQKKMKRLYDLFNKAQKTVN